MHAMLHFMNANPGGIYPVLARIAERCGELWSLLGLIAKDLVIDTAGLSVLGLDTGYPMLLELVAYLTCFSLHPSPVGCTARIASVSTKCILPT